MPNCFLSRCFLTDHAVRLGEEYPARLRALDVGGEGLEELPGARRALGRVPDEEAGDRPDVAGEGLLDPGEELRADRADGATRPVDAAAAARRRATLGGDDARRERDEVGQAGQESAPAR